MNTLRWLQKNLMISIPAFMLLGLVFGALIQAQFLKSLIVPLTFLMVYPMMVTLNMRELFARGGAKLQWTALLLNFGMTPFLGLLTPLVPSERTGRMWPF